MAFGAHQSLIINLKIILTADQANQYLDEKSSHEEFEREILMEFHMACIHGIT